MLTVNLMALKPNRGLNAKELFDGDNCESFLLITGDEQTGKTALIRTVIERFHQSGNLCLYFPGKELSRLRIQDFFKFLTKTLKHQFVDATIGQWDELSRSRKVAFIDDFDEVTKRSGIGHGFLEFLEKRVGRIVLTADSSMEVNEWIDGELVSALDKFSRYRIQPYGYKFRYDLIRKWVRLGRNSMAEAEEIIAQIDRAEKATQIALIKNLVPRTPMYCLTLLQSVEGSQVATLQASGVAQYYEYLIRQGLSKAGVEFREFAEIFNYLSHFAWELSRKDARVLNRIEVGRFTSAYSQEYTLVDASERIGVLERSDILCVEGDQVSFKYGYLEYYFLGKYFADRISDDTAIQQEILHQCAHLYVRKFADTVLFVIHHTKAPIVVNAIRSSLSKLFEDVSPLDLISDTSAVATLIDQGTHLIFQDSDPELNRRKNHMLRDELEAEFSEAKQDETRDSAELAASVTTLLKTVDLLGQILKTYYGTLRKPLKKELVKDLFEAPLRALRQLVDAMESDKDGIIEELRKRIEFRDKLTDSEKRKIAAEILFEILGVLVSAFVLKVGRSVGVEQLIDVIESLRAESSSLTFDMLALAARLDQPLRLPMEEIRSLATATVNNQFAHRLLQLLAEPQQLQLTYEHGPVFQFLERVARDARLTHI